MMTKPPFRYRAFGLAIDSDFALQELQTRKSGAADMVIRAATVPPPQAVASGFRHHEVTPEGDLLAYADVGRFLVRGAKCIDVDPEPGFDLGLMGLAVLGPVMACHFHRAGFLVLHGSAVAIGGEAHVFLGDKGSGKSTTAAALVAAGFPLIADDVVVLDLLDDGRASVRSAFPAMKLDEAMMARFPAGSCHVIKPDGGPYTAGKSRVRLSDHFCAETFPLGPVHCLSRGAENGIRTLPASQVLHALIRFSHHPRLGPAANTPDETAGLFSLAARYAPLVRGDMLTVKDSLAEIARLGEFLSPGVKRDAVAA